MADVISIVLLPVLAILTAVMLLQAPVVFLTLFICYRRRARFSIAAALTTLLLITILPVIVANMLKMGENRIVGLAIWFACAMASFYWYVQRTELAPQDAAKRLRLALPAAVLYTSIAFALGLVLPPDLPLRIVRSAVQYLLPG